MDKIIKQLVDRCREQFSYYDIVDECSEAVDYGSIIEFLFGQIANCELIEWISVKDRLPDVGRDVLFVCENKSYGVGAYSDTYRDFFSGQFPVKAVTHWMPLLQPPKGD